MRRFAHSIVQDDSAIARRSQPFQPVWGPDSTEDANADLRGCCDDACSQSLIAAQHTKRVTELRTAKHVPAIPRCRTLAIALKLDIGMSVIGSSGQQGLNLKSPQLHQAGLGSSRRIRVMH